MSSFELQLVYLLLNLILLGLSIVYFISKKKESESRKLKFLIIIFIVVSFAVNSIPIDLTGLKYKNSLFYIIVKIYIIFLLIMKL